MIGSLQTFLYEKRQQTERGEAAELAAKSKFPAEVKGYCPLVSVSTREWYR